MKMCKKCWFKKTKLRIIAVFVFGAAFFLQCNLFGPEPGEPVFPAQIDLGDSAAVRAILDSNNLKNISVRRAIDPSSWGRITMLTLDALGLDSFTFTHDFQRLDSLLAVGLTRNTITKVTVSDSLKYSKGIYIELSNNLLTEFPNSLFKIFPLWSVDISYNKIFTISKELMTSGFRQIDFDHNKLCSVSDTVKLWLDSVQNNWANFQDCP
jgi:Leucine-rich repeat (LRR) protein